MGAVPRRARRMCRAWVPHTRKKESGPWKFHGPRGELADRERLHAQTPATAFRGPGRVEIVGSCAEEGAHDANRVNASRRVVKRNGRATVALASGATALYCRRPIVKGWADP